VRRSLLTEVYPTKVGCPFRLTSNRAETRIFRGLWLHGVEVKTALRVDHRDASCKVVSSAIEMPQRTRPDFSEPRAINMPRLDLQRHAWNYTSK
jgi:hypothetical protein